MAGKVFENAVGTDNMVDVQTDPAEGSIVSSTPTYPPTQSSSLAPSFTFYHLSQICSRNGCVHTQTHSTQWWHFQLISSILHMCTHISSPDISPWWFLKVELCWSQIKSAEVITHIHTLHPYVDRWGVGNATSGPGDKHFHCFQPARICKGRKGNEDRWAKWGLCIAVALFLCYHSLCLSPRSTMVLYSGADSSTAMNQKQLVIRQRARQFRLRLCVSISTWEGSKRKAGIDHK